MCCKSFSNKWKKSQRWYTLKKQTSHTLTLTCTRGQVHLIVGEKEEVIRLSWTHLIDVSRRHQFSHGRLMDRKRWHMTGKYQTYTYGCSHPNKHVAEVACHRNDLSNSYFSLNFFTLKRLGGMTCEPIIKTTWSTLNIYFRTDSHGNHTPSVFIYPELWV
jgi:hypothetical protein